MLRKRRAAISIEATFRGLPFFMKKSCMNSNCRLKAVKDTVAPALSLSPGPAIAALGRDCSTFPLSLRHAASTTMLLLQLNNVCPPFQRRGFSPSRKHCVRVSRPLQWKYKSALSAAASAHTDMTGNHECISGHAALRSGRHCLVRCFFDRNSRHQSARRQPRVDCGVIGITGRKSPH